jgi:hypothetical protein
MRLSTIVTLFAMIVVGWSNEFIYNWTRGTVIQLQLLFKSRFRVFLPVSQPLRNVVPRTAEPFGAGTD